MRRWVVIPVLAVIVACGAATATTTSSQGTPGTCAYPTDANTYDDASGLGCHPGPPNQVCVVGNGATVLPDGAVSGGTETCKSECATSQYELTCSGATTLPQGAIPSPEPSLGCTVVPISTPSDVLFYCCPCAD